MDKSEIIDRIAKNDVRVIRDVVNELLINAYDKQLAVRVAECDAKSEAEEN